MKWKLTLFNSIFALFILSACGDILEDYQSSVVDPMSIDENICNILNETESVTAYTFSNDSLSIVSLFDSLVQDTSTFITLSNVQNWRIPVDSISYFMVFAPQAADSYFVALNSSSGFHLYNSEGNVVVASDTATSLKNIAGCSDVRTRKVYSGLSGAYVGKVVNPNVTSLKMVMMNTNQGPEADFNVSQIFPTVGDTIEFKSQSQSGAYPIISYYWHFGDENHNSDSSIVQHAYSDSGKYSPSLTVSDGYLFHTVLKIDHIMVTNGDSE